MDLRSLLAAIVWLMAPMCQAYAADPSSLRPVCDGKFGLCRYIEAKTPKEVIPARFDRAMPFSEGMAAVSIAGRFGYIDTQGDVVIAPKFDLAGEFRHGLAEILVGDKIGIVNRAGEIVVPPMFKRAFPLSDDVLLAVEGKWERVHYEGFEQLENLEIGLSTRHMVGLYSIAGHWIHPPTLANVVPFDRNGPPLIWATEISGNSRPVGLMAGDGRWILTPQFEYASRAVEGIAIVRKKVDGVAMSGAVNAAGRFVIPLKPWLLSYWDKGWGIARQDGKEGLVDNNGNLIGGRFFDKVERGDPDIAAVLVDGQWKGLDRAGNIVPHPRNGRVYASCPSGIRVTEIDGKMQVIGADGQPTTPYRFERVTQRPSCDGPFAVQLDRKWGFVGPDGRLLRDPIDFDDTYGFKDGYAAVRQGTKWGVIDARGRFSVAATFDSLMPGAAGLYRATTGGQTVWINATGEEQPEPPPKPLLPAEALACGHGVRMVQRDDRWGIADDSGDVVTPKYRAVVCFRNGIAWAPIEDRRQWCPIGPDGALREKPVCRTTQYPPVLSSHHFPERLDPDPFESSVLWTRGYLDFKNGQRNEPPRLIGDGVRGKGVILPH